ncbi:MAG: aminodeoxychorismate/anthranilate synthase component II [Oscillospiraceae bacterium]|nr:aminodeoxychorismate/anthranilate synthase component II [Oscillospiraceae bacterium]MDD4368778.1 aminodeoxychorismate/anthranilate synthase component II [Oscillospiraceae bacterium]
MILLIDNYDSFSYNLYQMEGEIEPDIRVIRNDQLTVAEIRALRPEGIIISPGPGRPEDAGMIVELVRQLVTEIPILGVCLGHQAICLALGGEVTYAKQLMHGKSSLICPDRSSPVFASCSPQIQVGRYHSLAVRESSLPACLRVTARAEDGEVMAVEHTGALVYGLQFHPESILTPEGDRILRQFTRLAKCHVSQGQPAGERCQ